MIALALGGEPGARLARELGLLTSADTLLRRLKAGGAEPDLPTPRCLGVDDWAWKKGRRYGTLHCVLERGRIVDLLPERSAESLVEWLRRHPGVEVVSRDRAGVYAEGASTGVPGAVQVADRFHLFKKRCRRSWSGSTASSAARRRRPAARPVGRHVFCRSGDM